MKYALTSPQYDALDFIRKHIARHGVAPRFADIAAALGPLSKQAITDRLAALERKGMIRRVPFKARGILVTAQGARQTQPGLTLPAHMPRGARIALAALRRGRPELAVTLLTQIAQAASDETLAPAPKKKATP